MLWNKFPPGETFFFFFASIDTHTHTLSASHSDLDGACRGVQICAPRPADHLSDTLTTDLCVITLVRELISLSSPM